MKSSCWGTVRKIHLIITLSLTPALAKAAIPLCYFPAYNYQPILGSQVRTPASINRAAIMVSTPSRIFYGEDGKSISPELIANFNQIKSTEKPLDMVQIIPLDMRPSNDSSAVLNQVADRTLTSWLNSDSVRQSSLGRTASEVESKMRQEVVIGGEDPKSIQHKLNFSVLAFQTLAQLQYTGYTNAALKYKASENKVALELFEKVASNQDVVMSYTSTPAERISEVSFRWNF